MKRHQIVMLICGVLMAVVCLGAGWFLFSEMMAKNAAAEARNQNYDELQRIYSAKVFPSRENTERLKEDQQALEKWLITASNLVHKSDLQIEAKTPAVFKQTLQSTVRALSAHPGAINGKIVSSGFNFGFDKYLGESDSLPSKENVDRLSQQLTIIDMICKELYTANILALERITRDAFDEQQVSADQPKQEDQSSRRRRRRDDPDGAKASVANVSNAGENFSKQRFTFEFQARPAAFIQALNRLAAMDLFVVVAEAEFRKTGDPLVDKRASKKKGGAAEGEGVTDPAKLTHVERIVTGPELEPPVRVKLDLDVFSFTGV